MKQILVLQAKAKQNKKYLPFCNLKITPNRYLLFYYFTFLACCRPFGLTHKPSTWWLQNNDTVENKLQNKSILKYNQIRNNLSDPRSTQKASITFVPDRNHAQWKIENAQSTWCAIIFLNQFFDSSPLFNHFHLLRAPTSCSNLKSHRNDFGAYAYECE